jgi:hypothetical protein
METYANDHIVECSILPPLMLCNWHSRNEKGYERDICKKASHCSARGSSAGSKEDLEDAEWARPSAPPNMYAFFLQDLWYCPISVFSVVYPSL